MRMKIRKTALILTAVMGLSLLAGCDNEKQQIFKEAEKDLEQGSYEYALDEFTTSVNNGVKPAVSYRGIGICQLRLGNYDDAITAFTSALGEEKVNKSMARDLYLYRATARLQAGYLDDAMADCQVLAQNYEMDADAWFLTGKVALEMDGYDEAPLILSRPMARIPAMTAPSRFMRPIWKRIWKRTEPDIWKPPCPQRPRIQMTCVTAAGSIAIWEDYANARTELTRCFQSREAQRRFSFLEWSTAPSQITQMPGQCTSSTSIRSWMIRPGIDTDCRTGIQWTGCVRYGRRKL
ncbi:MAG: tetratricopeptide repeat protein [Ruminococcus sp.]